MAIPWMWVLKTVPWSEVIANAPKLVDGARKLWGSVSKQASAPRQTDDGASTVPGSAPAEATLARLHERVGDLEANLEAVHGQILASSELSCGCACAGWVCSPSPQASSPWRLWRCPGADDAAALAGHSKPSPRHRSSVASQWGGRCARHLAIRSPRAASMCGIRRGGRGHGRR